VWAGDRGARGCRGACGVLLVAVPSRGAAARHGQQRAASGDYRVLPSTWPSVGLPNAFELELRDSLRSRSAASEGLGYQHWGWGWGWNRGYGWGWNWGYGWGWGWGWGCS